MSLFVNNRLHVPVCINLVKTFFWSLIMFLFASGGNFLFQIEMFILIIIKVLLKIKISRVFRKINSWNEMYQNSKKEQPLTLSQNTLGQWFSTFFSWRHILHTIIFSDTFLSQNTCVSDKFACSFLKMISQNNLATHWRKLVTHKCVATSCLRNTALGSLGWEPLG